MTLKAVLFDFDGLLVDTESVWFEEWRALFGTFDLDLTPEIWARVVGSLSDPHAELEAELGRSIDRAIGRGADDRAWSGCQSLDLREGGWALLRLIDEAELSRAVVTSSDSAWIRSHMDRLVCDGWAAIVSADGDPSRSKPSPTLYLEALEILQLEPHEAVVLEDSTNGIIAAKAAGIRCIAVPNGVTQAFDLTAADHIAASLADLDLSILGWGSDRVGDRVGDRHP